MQDIIENSPGVEFFPVVNHDSQLIGIVNIDQITPVLFDSKFAGTLLVFDLMEIPRRILNEDDDLARAMSLLEKNHLDHLPVNKIDGQFMGFVSAADIFKLYRGLIREADSY